MCNDHMALMNIEVEILRHTYMYFEDLITEFAKKKLSTKSFRPGRLGLLLLKCLHVQLAYRLSILRILVSYNVGLTV